MHDGFLLLHMNFPEVATIRSKRNKFALGVKILDTIDSDLKPWQGLKLQCVMFFFRRNKDRNWLILWMNFQLKDLETVSFQLLLTNIRSQPFIPGRGGLGMTLHGNFIGWGKQCNQWPPQILEGLFIAEYCLALEQDR